jgi:hypothetical protein
MADDRFTAYFENEVLRKRSYLKKEWCAPVLGNSLRSEPREGNRHRFWGQISELEGRYLRVITLEDKVTIHNAFPDRRFKP